MDAKNLLEARKAAEQAVEGMPDGDLKVKAFEVILNRILSLPDQTVQPNKLGGSKRHRQNGTRSSSPAAGTDQANGIPVSAPDRILTLKADGFFSEQRGIGDIREELQTHGWRYDVTALSGTLMKLVRAKHLRRAKTTDGNKTSYKYFNP
jgi:hypothetical protein